MIEPQKDISSKKEKNIIQESDNSKKELIQNLQKQSALSHTHSRKVGSSIQNKKLFQTIANKNQSSSLSSNHQKLKTHESKLESVMKQIQDQKDSDNQFINEYDVNNKIMLNGYFASLAKQITKKKAQKIAKQSSLKIQQSVSINISKGFVIVSKYQEDIKNLLIDLKLSSQELRILQKRAQAQAKQKKIMLLDPYLQQKKQKHHTQTKHDSFQKFILDDLINRTVLSKQEHKKLIEKFALSNRQIHQKKKQRLFEIQQRQRSLSHEKMIAEQQRKKRQKQLRRHSIEQKLVKRKNNHQNFILQEKISTKQYKQMQNKKFLYEKMQEKYKSQVLIPSLQQKKRKLKEIRDFNKRYEIQQIKKHQKQYLDKKSFTSSKDNSQHKINTFDYKPPEKSKRLVQLLYEEKYRDRIKFEEQKRKAQENKLKQINFISDLKIKFKPKIDQSKRSQIEKRLQSQEAQKSKSIERDPKLLGMKYFQDAKKFAKKRKNKQKTEGGDRNATQQQVKKARQNRKQKTEGRQFLQKEDQQNEFLKIKINKKSPIIRPQKQVNLSFSQNSNNKINIHDEKRKQIRKIINSNGIQRQVKLQRLKIQNEKITQIYKRREKFFRQNEDDQKTRQQAVGLLLNSIQAKMGIIDLCTKR